MKLSKIFILLFLSISTFNIYSNATLEEIQSLQKLVDPLKPKRKEIKKRINAVQAEIQAKLASKQRVFEPVISVIIPCYNRANVLPQALNSIIAQQDIANQVEVVCVDDASKDDTLKILLEYERRYDNIFVYRHIQNQGGSAARNTAIMYARGKYIFNLDSDDFLANNALSSILKLATEKNADIVYPGYANIFEHNKYNKAEKWTLAASKIDNFNLGIWSKFGEGWLTSVVCKLFTKDSWLQVGGFVEVSGHDAIAFSIAELLSGYTMEIDYNTFYNHRLWPDNSSKFGVEHQTRTLNDCPFITLLNHLETLSISDLNLVLKDNKRVIDKLGIFQLLPLNCLDNLFAARKLKQSKNYSAACDKYRQAIELGATHIKVQLEFASCLCKNNQADEAEIILENIKKEINDYETLTANNKTFYVVNKSSKPENNPFRTPSVAYASLNLSRKQFLRLIRKTEYVSFSGDHIDLRLRKLEQNNAVAFYTRKVEGQSTSIALKRDARECYAVNLRNRKVRLDPQGTYKASFLQELANSIGFNNVSDLMNKDIIIKNSTFLYY